VDSYLIDQETVAVADCVIDLLTHPGKAKKMAEAGKAKVEQLCAWPKLAEKTSQIYESVCRGH
jgi:glycosyltransferase involved in cell wall biosynthesis